MRKSLILIVEMPQAINYQFVACDMTGNVLSEKRIGVKVEILKNSPSGNIVFVETHTPTSTKAGIINLRIGKGTNLFGSLATIDRSSGIYFLQISIDAGGGTDYEKVYIARMRTVPYRFYSAEKGVSENEGEDNESSAAAKFVLVADNGVSRLTEVLNGFILEGVDDTTLNFYLEFHMIYLDGIDQSLNIAIEKCSGTSVKEQQEDWQAGTQVLTTMGRLCFIRASKISKGIHHLNLLVKDQNDLVLREYPFILEVEG